VCDAFVERSENVFADLPHCGGVRVGAQEKKGLVETNQGSGIVKMSPAELGQEPFYAQAARRLEAAL
jgi:hypothetical protein